jgi:hypothetical protein
LIGLRSVAAFLLATLLTASVAAQADTWITARPGLNSRDADKVTATRATFSYAYVIANNSGKKQRITVVAQPILRSIATPCNLDNGDDCRLGWYLDKARLEEDDPKSFDLAANRSKILTFQGAASALGVYESEAIVSGDGSPHAARVSVTRALLSLGEAPLAAISGGRFVQWESAGIPVTIKNGGAERITLTELPRATIAQNEGGGGYAIARPEVVPACKPVREERAYILNPGDKLDCTLTLPSLPNGKFRTKVELAQPGLTTATTTADFTVRRSVWVCVAFLLAGAVIGALIYFWQNNKRVRTLQAIQAIDLRSDYAGLMGKLTSIQEDSRLIIEQIDNELAAIVQRLEVIHDANYEARIALFRSLLPIVRNFSALETLFRAKAANVPEYNAARAALGGDDAEAARRAMEALAVTLDKPSAQARGFAPMDHPIGGGLRGWLEKPISRSTLTARLKRVEAVIAILSIAIATMIGVGALWAPAPDWGSVFDWTVAFLTGLGATISGTVGLDTIAGSYKAQLRTGN